MWASPSTPTCKHGTSTLCIIATVIPTEREGPAQTLLQRSPCSTIPEVYLFENRRPSRCCRSLALLSPDQFLQSMRAWADSYWTFSVVASKITYPHLNNISLWCTIACGGRQPAGQGPGGRSSPLHMVAGESAAGACRAEIRSLDPRGISPLTRTPRPSRPPGRPWGGGPGLHFLCISLVFPPQSK